MMKKIKNFSVPIFPKKDIKNVFISTYPSVKCGIATFTKDLTTALNMLNPNQLSRIVAINPQENSINYPWEVIYKINHDNKDEYLKTAGMINQEKFDIACLQHEFGIFGGKDGENILSLVSKLKIPLATTFHTVLKNPSENQKRIVKTISKISKIVVVVSQTPKRRLTNLYDVPPEKILVIPHGIPDYPFSPPDLWKGLLDLEGLFVMGTFGLVSKNKGYEYLIKALPGVIKKHPKTRLLIVGETHPKVKKEEGEKYREELGCLTEKLNLGKNVFFVNKYFSTAELTSIIQAMDVFVTPYLNPQQISSGALSYAVGLGRPCISTPFTYAKDLLRENRGMMVPFRKADKIAEAVNYLIENPDYRIKMAHSCYLYGRRMTWVKVADSYLDVFKFLTTIYGKKSI